MRADDVDRRLLDLAERIAEGAPVDWSDPEASEAALGPVTVELKVLETLASHLRESPATPRSSGPPELEGFTIVRELGSGGAGVVYLARDLRLERLVAIKTLPSDFALDAERLARIEREAKLLASLNHPNIATIHGIGEGAHGSRVLLLEYVAGETLAARLRAGALPLSDTLAIAAQMAEALEVAHEGGVIHRDLKPANVMLGPRGRVKVLDFGLARRREPAAAEREATIAGTWAYLGPECLTRSEDHRADVFAFGCVLYECLTGRRAFPGETAAETLAAVIGREPDWTLVPSDVPDSIRVLLEDCLAKDPEHRLSDMGRAGRILEQVRRASEGGEVVTAAPAVVPGLPRHATNFIGRGREQTECRRALMDTALVTLTGPGGSGKTRLAVEVAAGLHERFGGGVWFVDLAPTAEPARVPDAVAAVVGVHDQGGLPLTHQIVERLRGHRALIVLDNCEHVLAAAADLVRILGEECADLAILATSREPLGVGNEQRIEIEPLALPTEREQVDPAAIARAEAVRLFVDRAMRADSAFVADSATLPVVAEICRRVDALPLAIELAAARVSVLSPTEIAERLDRQLQLLRDATGRSIGRHETMRATIAWSADQLTAQEARTFRMLAVFAGGWSLEAATAVCEPSGDEFEVLDRLARLVDKSLVVVDRRRGDASRYRLLEPIRQFALERLAESGESDATQARHLAYVVGLAERAEAGLYGQDQSSWLARLKVDHDNLLAALEACDRLPGGAESALRIVASIRRLWITNGQLRLGEDQCMRALARAGSATPPRLHARAITALTSLRFRQNLSDRAELVRLDLQALELFRRAGDRRGMSGSLCKLGAHASFAGDFVAARDWVSQSRELDREDGDDRAFAISTHNLGVICWRQRDLSAALDHMLESHALLQTSGDRSEQANGAVNVAFLQMRLGHRAEATRSLVEALRFFLEVGTRTDRAAAALLGAAELALRAGDFEPSARLDGAADALLAATHSHRAKGEPPWDEHDALEARLKDELGEASLAAARAAGREMSSEDAIRLALEALRAGPD